MDSLFALGTFCAVSIVKIPKYRHCFHHCSGYYQAVGGRSQCYGWGLGIDNNTSKAISNLQSFKGIDTVILQAGKIYFSFTYCDYVMRLYKIENRYFCKYDHCRVVIIYLAFIIRNFEIFCVTLLKKMVIWVAILPRVDQLTKVMPNFWRAV